MSTILSQIFFIRSKEHSICPACGHALRVRDSRKRICIMEDGDRKNYQIRRLFCPHCCEGGCQHELPDFMMPFKHHELKIVEAELDGGAEHCPAHPDTRKLWVLWFTSIRNKAESLLQRYWHSDNFSLSSSSLLQFAQNCSPGWLKLIVVLLIESG